MASSSSPPQPGSSSSSSSDNGFDEDMVALLLVGDQHAPQFKQELQCNGIKLVPSTWQKCDAGANCRLVEVLRKLQEVKADLELKFREQKYELERRLGEERNRIVALKNEQSRLTDEKFKITVFLRQLADSCEFRLDLKDDPLSSSVQEKLLEHVQNMAMNKEDKEDLVWARGVANQVEAILNSSPRRHNSTATGRPQLPQKTLLSSPFPVTSTISTPMDIDVRPAPAIPPSRQPSPPTFTPPASPPNRDISTFLPASTSSSVPYTFREDPPPPSIVIASLTTSPTAAPDPPSTSGSTNERVRLVERIRRVRNCGQFTEFAITSRRHAVHPASNQFLCTCGQVYKTRRYLKVHVRKMTQEWKFKCQKCKQYFFFQYDLKIHSKTSRCSRQNGTSATTNNVGHHDDSRQPEAGGGGFSPFNLNDWINTNVPLPPRPPPRARRQRQQGSSQRQRGGYRKLQQEILKRKQHGPWLSKLGGRVEGSWYCKCMQKFSSKSNLQFHILYWTKEWKFQCPHCERKFFCLSHLKRHMASFHKIPEPLKEYRLGCNLCGEMFHKTVENHRHKKLKHNPPAKRQRTGALERFRITSSMALTQSQPQPQPSSSTCAIPPPPSLPPRKIEIVELPSDDEDDEIVDVTPTSLFATTPPT